VTGFVYRARAWGERARESWENLASTRRTAHAGCAGSPGDAPAAIDVGSNSLHMVIAQADPDGAVTTLWRMKEMVGLAA